LTIKSAQHTKNSSQSSVYSSQPKTSIKALAADYRPLTVDCPSRRFTFQSPPGSNPERRAAACLQPPGLGTEN
jgi:hypothetical protein